MRSVSKRALANDDQAGHAGREAVDSSARRKNNLQGARRGFRAPCNLNSEHASGGRLHRLNISTRVFSVRTHILIRAAGA